MSWLECKCAPVVREYFGELLLQVLNQFNCAADGGFGDVCDDDHKEESGDDGNEKADSDGDDAGNEDDGDDFDGDDVDGGGWSW